MQKLSYMSKIAMKKELVVKTEMQLVGLSIRTNNKNEMHPETSQIGQLIQQFYDQELGEKILQRQHPGITYSVYTDYASNEYGDYTYFFGEEVTSLDTVPEGLSTLVIPSMRYQKFTTPKGKIPDIIVQAWQKIWAMSPEELGGKRAYFADFEIFDERASDIENAIVDIYIGLRD